MPDNSDILREHAIRRYQGGVFHSVQDTLVSEVRIELDINDGQAVLAMLCLPQELPALAVGFLLGEGVLHRVEDLREVAVDPEGRRIVARGDFDADALEALNRRWTWGSGCGGGGTSRDLNRPALGPVGPGMAVEATALLELLGQFQARLDIWRQTGGVHACGLARRRELILLAQDVGRHNAFDKVVGTAAMQHIDFSDKLILTTGRLSAEIVSKAVACRVPMLVSRCAVTSLAVDLARRFGLTLVGFVRNQRLNVYTGFERVLGGQDRPVMRSGPSEVPCQDGGYSETGEGAGWDPSGGSF